MRAIKRLEGDTFIKYIALNFEFYNKLMEGSNNFWEVGLALFEFFGRNFK